MQCLNQPSNTATTTASGNIPKPSPIYDRSSSTSSSRRPFSNITNIPPRTSIETGERNPVTSPEPIRTRYRGEDSSNTKPMDISTPSPKKSQTSANVSGSGGQQVSSAVAVSRRGGSKRYVLSMNIIMIRFMTKRIIDSPSTLGMFII